MPSEAQIFIKNLKNLGNLLLFERGSIDLSVFSSIWCQSCNIIATLNYKVLESRQEGDV